MEVKRQLHFICNLLLQFAICILQLQFCKFCFYKRQFAVLCRLIPRGAILICWDFQLQSLVFLNFSGSLLECSRAKFTPSKLACEVFHKGRRKWSRWVFIHKIVSQSLLRWFSLSFCSHLLQTAPLIPADPLFLIFIFWYILLVSCI